MNKHLILVFLLACHMNTFGQKADTTYHSNGQLKSVGTRDGDSKKTGEWRTYFESGKLKSIIQYQNGVEHGKWITYFESGNISSEGQFTNGTKSGKWNYYYPSGKLKSRTNYATGEIEHFNE